MIRVASDAPTSECPSEKSLSKIVMIAAAEACALLYAAIILTAALAPAALDTADRPYVGPARIVRK